MDPHRCYQLKQAYIADLHRQAERDALARAARTPRQQRAPGRPALLALVVKPKFESVIGQYKKEVETRSGGSAQVTIDGDAVRTVMNVLAYRFMFTSWETP
jgi:hypothetical protein